MSTTETTRSLHGTEVPAPGTYELDASHSRAGFVVRHMVVSKVKGSFSELSGSIHITDEPLDSWVEVELAAASIDTGNADRDGHLRSGDFFDVEQHPAITFRSTEVHSVGDGRFRVAGDLTIKGVTRTVELDTTFEGGVTDPWGNDRIAFSASTKVNREDFGLTWNQALEAGGVVVAKEVTIEIDAQAVRPA